MKRRLTVKRMGKLTAAMAIVLAIACLTGCGGNSSNGRAEGTQKVSLCEVTHSVFYAPLYAAIELGCFQEEGLDIELINGGGADKVMTAVISGQADIGFAGPEACIYTYLEGHDDYPKVFGQLTKRDGSFVMGRSREDFSWENLKGKTILGGRKGGVPEMTLEYVLKDHGLIPGKDVDVDTSVQFNMMAGAFTGGSGDYVTLFEPTASEMERSGEGFVLASVGEESGEIPYTTFFALQSYMKENPEVVDRFAAAVSRGLVWVQEHDPAETAELVKNQFPDSSAEVLTEVIKRYLDIDAWNETLVMEEGSFDRLQDVMEEAGELERRVPFDEITDNSWAEQIDQDQYR